MGDQSKQTTPATTPNDNMGYAPIVPETTLPENSNAVDAQTLINKAVKEVTVGEDGKYVYPDNMDPNLKAAVAATKSYRDNQAGFTKSQQSLKESEAETVALREKLAELTKKPLELTQERQTELDTLMQTDPNAWRIEMNRLEAESQTASTEAMDAVTAEVKQKAGAEFELERRFQVLEDFNTLRDTPITVDMLDNDIPPRINSQLTEGKISFDDYLVMVADYLSTGKVVKQEKLNVTTDLNKSAGGGSGSQAPKEEDAIDYSTLRL